MTNVNTDCIRDAQGNLIDMAYTIAGYAKVSEELLREASDYEWSAGHRNLCICVNDAIGNLEEEKQCSIAWSNSLETLLRLVKNAREHGAGDLVLYVD